MDSQRTKSILINVISCTISAVLLFLLAINWDKPQFNSPNNKPTADATNSTFKIETSLYTKPVPLATEAVITYMNTEPHEKVFEIYSAFNGGGGGLNYGLAWDFTYQITGMPIGLELSEARLVLSQDENFEETQEYNLDVGGYECSLYNLIPNTKYYYRLNLKLSDGTKTGTVGEFETVKSPRILNVEGAVNARDIGGYETFDGKKIKYGLLYRGSEIDGKVESDFCLTEKGKSQMLDVLKVKYDMDLRAKAETKDAPTPLGANVEHKYYGASAYSNFLKSDHNAKTRELFSALADKDNYPIYLHCTYGRDRTGTLMYLLEALLGVDDETLYKEYALSAFTDKYLETEKFETFVSEIDSMRGFSTKQKVENWLLSIGVSQSEINNIREILLEN